MSAGKLYHEVMVSPHDKATTKHYSIYIGEHLLNDAQLISSFIPDRQVLIVTNETIAPLYLKSVKAALKNFQCDSIILPDGEKYKTQDSVNKIHEALISHGHTRHTTVIALGGGVIGDMSGFAASTYQRGVHFIQMPTTLLAAVDASVGGKTAINHPKAKNMIGSFYQPRAVFVDLSCLETLLPREFYAGTAEIIKYGLIEGGAFFDDLPRLLSDKKYLPELIAACCKIKAAIVGLDALDKTGQRALLNLGHTFAHAFESCTKYERFLHGEAVAIGLYCALLLSHKSCGLSQDVLQRVDKLLAHMHLPRRLPLDMADKIDEIYGLMHQDKKRISNVLPFILLRAPGDCFVDVSQSEASVKEVLRLAIQADFT